MDYAGTSRTAGQYQIFVYGPFQSRAFTSFVRVSYSQLASQLSYLLWVFVFSVCVCVCVCACVWRGWNRGGRESCMLRALSCLNDFKVFMSYLIDRKQHVSINGRHSNLVSVLWFASLVWCPGLTPCPSFIFNTYLTLVYTLIMCVSWCRSILIYFSS